VLRRPTVDSETLETQLLETQLLLAEAFDDLVVIETLPTVDDDWMPGEFDI